MQTTDYQKYLKFASILNAIDGAFTLVLGLLSLGGGVLMGVAAPTAVATSEEMAAIAGTGIFAGLVGVIILIAAAFTLTQAILGLRASKDASKVNPIWWVSVIALALAAIGAVSAIANGTLGITVLLQLVLCGVTFWAANGIKNQVPEQVIA